MLLPISSSLLKQVPNTISVSSTSPIYTIAGIASCSGVRVWINARSSAYVMFMLFALALLTYIHYSISLITSQPKNCIGSPPSILCMSGLCATLPRCLACPEGFEPPSEFTVIKHHRCLACPGKSYMRAVAPPGGTYLWCGRRDSNSHGLGPQDFKSCVSTDSTTPAIGLP